MCAAVCSVHHCILFDKNFKYILYRLLFMPFRCNVLLLFAHCKFDLLRIRRFIFSWACLFKIVITIYVVVVVIIITRTLFIVIWHIVLLSTHKIAWKPQNIYKKKRIIVSPGKRKNFSHINHIYV